jgi:hypothetical protein
MNVEFWRLWKEVGYLLNVPSRHLPGGTENKHNEPLSEFCEALES